jgi:hypothetical protein
MQPAAMTGGIERLLTREARARLPFFLLLRLYLDPGALFKDATRGPARERQHALSYNRRMRWMLLTYVRRWMVIAALFFFGIEPAQAMSCIPAAACAVSGGIAVTVAAVTVAAYFLLGATES